MPSDFGEILKKELYPSLLVAAATSIAGPLLFDIRTVGVPFMGINGVPANIAVGCAVGASNFVGGLVEDLVMKNLDPATADSIGMAVRPVANGLASYAVISTTILSNPSFQNSFILGSSSTVAASYAGELLQLQ